LIHDREAFWVGLVLLPKLKEACLTNAESVLDLLAAEKTSGIRVQEESDLFVGEPLVKLSHGYLLSKVEAASMGIRFSSEKSSLLN